MTKGGNSGLVERSNVHYACRLCEGGTPTLLLGSRTFEAKISSLTGLLLLNERANQYLQTRATNVKFMVCFVRHPLIDHGIMYWTYCSCQVSKSRLFLVEAWSSSSEDAHNI